MGGREGLLRVVKGLCRIVEGCRGLWRVVEGLEGLCRVVESCGGLCREIKDCGGTWSGGSVEVSEKGGFCAGSGEVFWRIMNGGWVM